MKKLLSILFLVCGSMIFAQNKTIVENVDPSAFKKAIDEKKGILIDLRTDDELKKGMIKGATQLNFLAKDAEEQIAKLDHNKTYLIYCAGGGRSGDCVDLMKKQGFAHVIHLEKGFEDWKKRGFESSPKE
jgi:phage shock protein E